MFYIVGRFGFTNQMFYWLSLLVSVGAAVVKEGGIFLSDCAMRHWLYLELKGDFKIKAEESLNLFLDRQASKS